MFVLMCIYLCFVIIHLLNSIFSGCIHYLFDPYQFTKKTDELENISCQFRSVTSTRLKAN